ncbi:MAG: hypothetical protein IPP32_00035 [Bacteroidetes bacterium]|nr:hypothetical protein [Bacteroidota bacterium]
MEVITVSDRGNSINFTTTNQINLENGYNDFTVDNPILNQGSVMLGSINTYSINSLTGQKFIPAHNNKWVDEPLPITKPNLPSNLTYIALLGNSLTGRINIIDDSPNFNVCAEGPSPDPINYYGLGLPINYCPKCPPVKSENFWNTPMNDALKSALTLSVDESNSDNFVNSFSMFYDIFNKSITYEESRINWETEFAYLKLKELFGVLIIEDKIAKVDESNEYCAKILKAESRLIELSREKDDDLKEFYYSIDLATTYRLIGDYEAALRIFE